MEQKFYKFRSLNNIRWFIDILLNQRLYAAKYDEFNDPMEGHYLTSPSNIGLIHELKAKKENIRICSLTQDYKHTLLWSHYADGHHGCCIEVTLPCNTVSRVNYTDALPRISNFVSTEQLLSHKSLIWEYEKEYRIFSSSSFIDVKVTRVIFGMRVNKSDYDFYKKLIKSIDNTIRVNKITREEIFDGFNSQ